MIFLASSRSESKAALLRGGHVEEISDMGASVRRSHGRG
jgi:hypothetical protein